MSAGPTGLFLAFEGPEGSGKSSQVTRLAERLRSAGVATLVTREPGGSPAGERIRDVLLDPELRLDPLAELLLYAAARSQHVVERIAPAMAAGTLVLTDRFSAATVAYQGYGRALDLSFVHELNTRVTLGHRPHLTLLLDIAPEVGLARVAARGSADRLERADLDFHHRVRAGFLAQAAYDFERWRVIDAHDDEERVAAAVWAAVEPVVLAWQRAARE